MTTVTVDVTERKAAQDAVVDMFIEGTEVNNSGVRVIPKKIFIDAVEKQGVSEADYKKVQAATDFVTTAAARVAMADTEKKISESSKSDLENEEFRRGISSTVRLPTFGGNTEVEFFAEKTANVPARGDVPASVKISHGRIRTTINTKARIDKELLEEAQLRIRAALGIKD
jgi:hypothetical protein